MPYLDVPGTPVVHQNHAEDVILSPCDGNGLPLLITWTDEIRLGIEEGVAVRKAPTAGLPQNSNVQASFPGSPNPVSFPGSPNPVSFPSSPNPVSFPSSPNPVSFPGSPNPL